MMVFLFLTNLCYNYYMNKSVVMIFMVVGSIIGGYIPSLFGADMFSLSSILCSAGGGLIGVWLGYRLIV